MDKYRIDGHKLFWHLDRVAAWQKGELPAPIYLEVSPVSYCNHRCIFCGIDFAMDKGVRLDTPAFCDRLREMGKLVVRSIMFAGEGEPLLHKDLPLFVRIARESGIDVSITTNGSLGNEALWRELLPHLSWLRFSVDAGTAEVYAQVHGVAASSFQSTLNSIASAVAVKKELKLPVTIGVQFLIMEENVSDIEEAIRVFSSMGVQYFALKPYSRHPKAIKDKDVVYSPETAACIAGLAEKYQPLTETALIFRKETLLKYFSKERNYGHCYALPFWGYVTSKGDFYTCSVFIGDEKFRAGNLYDQKMEELFFGEARKRSVCYARNELDLGHDCRINCRMARVNEFLELLANPPEHVNFV